MLDDENLNRAEPTRTGGRSGTGRAEHGSSRTDLASGSVTTPLAHGRCQRSVICPGEGATESHAQPGRGRSWIPFRRSAAATVVWETL